MTIGRYELGSGAFREVVPNRGFYGYCGRYLSEDLGDDGESRHISLLCYVQSHSGHIVIDQLNPVFLYATSVSIMFISQNALL